MRSSLSVFVLVKGVTMSSVRWLKNCYVWLPTRSQGKIVIDSRVTPQDLCNEDYGWRILSQGMQLFLEEFCNLSTLGAPLHILFHLRTHIICKWCQMCYTYKLPKRWKTLKRPFAEYQKLGGPIQSRSTK